MGVNWEAVGAVAAVLALFSYLYVEREKFPTLLRLFQLFDRIDGARSFVPKPPRRHSQSVAHASFAAPTGQPRRSRGALLDVVSSETWRESVHVDGETIFGRKPEVGVFALGDRFMSGRHTRFRAAGGRLYVTDLDSKNRTFVNEQPLTPHQERELRPGDTVRMGNTVLRLARVD